MHNVITQKEKMSSEAPINRIEYIDAMRGFTMMLVVFAHVLLFSFHHTDPNSFNTFFQTFRMPLFFFVSGFILWKPNTIWDTTTSLSFLYKKFRVQIVATIIFLSLYSSIEGFGFNQVLFSNTKMGYWFTIELFQYFLLYVGTHFIFDRFGKHVTDLVLTSLVFASIVISIKPWGIIPRGVYDAMDMTFLRFFIFFYFGIIIKRCFERFEHIIDNSSCMCTVLVTYFILITLYYYYNIFPYSIVIDLLIGLAGIIVVFAFFRKYRTSFSKDSRLGQIMQYVGTRTLDIYFLHYFFLPRNCGFIGEFFLTHSNPVVEMMIGGVISILVIAVCLTISSVIRLSPLLAHILFGIRKPTVPFT